MRVNSKCSVCKVPSKDRDKSGRHLFLATDPADQLCSPCIAWEYNVTQTLKRQQS